MKSLSGFYPLKINNERLQRFFDNSIGFILISVAFIILFGMLLSMLLTSCTDDNSKKKENGHVEVAANCIKLLSDYPESVKIIAVSCPDSVFGRHFFNDTELMEILDNVSSFNKYVSEKDAKFFEDDDPKIDYLIQRSASLANLFEELIAYQTSDGTFNGWKVKVLYECKNRFDEVIKNERYFIFDKDMNHIIHSFEIPIL